MKKIIALLLTAVIAFSFAISSLAAGFFGDLNNDGRVDSSDALIILKASTSLASLSNSQKVYADVNADGKVDSADALLVLQRAVGINSIFPAEKGEDPDLDHDIFG